MNVDPTLAVIAGGLGKRLHPLTLSIPKSLVAVGGTAFIDHQLGLFARKGLKKVVFCLGHQGELIRNHLGNTNCHGLDIHFSDDGKNLCGTGGAIFNALPLLGDEFLVTYGDSYLDIDYYHAFAAFRKSRQPALMTVYRNKNRWDHSNVEFDGTRIRRYDKNNRSQAMTYIDFGLLVFHKDCFTKWQQTLAFDLADLLAQLAKESLLAGYEVHQRFYEIGSAKGLADLEAAFKAQGHT